MKMRSYLKLLSAMFIGVFAFSTPRIAVAGEAKIPAGDADIVNQLVDQLGGADPEDRDRATIAIEDRPDCDLPLVQAAAARADLGLEQKMRLGHLLARMEPRVKAHARTQASMAVLTRWRSKDAVEFYAKDGHTDPAWNDAVLRTFELAARRGSTADAVLEEKFFKQEGEAIDQALAADCKDPDFLAFAALYASDAHKATDQVYALFKRAMDASEDGKVSPGGGVVIMGRILRLKAVGWGGAIDSKNIDPTVRLLCRMTDYYQAAAREPDVPADALIAFAQNVMKTVTEIHFKQQPSFDVIYRPLEKLFPNDSRTLCIKGAFNIEYAWEARGGGWANSVTQQGWTDFNDRLQTARDALARAWELDRGNTDAPTAMITVAMGQSWSQDDAEVWYRRAMDADPDNRQACRNMLLYLEPKWHGSPEALIKFGRECFETRNWRGDIPFTLIDAHLQLAAYRPDQATYFQNDSVWTDLSSVYSAYLSAYPADNYVRTNYARYACICGHWTEANVLFKKLGNNANAELFGGDADLKKAQEKAAQVAENAPKT